MNSAGHRALDGFPVFAPANVGRKSRAKPLPRFWSVQGTVVHWNWSVPGFPASQRYAALRKDSRTSSINATTVNRKSGGAKWRDLRFC